MFNKVTRLAVLLTALLSGGRCAAADCVSPPANLAAWWRAENNALDSSGAHDGTLQNGATYTPGMVGSALSFDGVNDAFTVPDSPSWDLGTSDFTIEFWLKFNSVKNTMFIHQQSGSAPGGFEFWYYTSTGAIYFDANPAYALINRTWAPVAGQWYHIAMVRSATACRLFVNGAQLGADQTDGTPITDVSGPLMFGNYASTPGYELNGLLDEVSIYQRALSVVELQAIYAAGSAGKCPASVPLTLAPATTNVQVGATVAFSPSGGQPPYAFTLATNNSGGTINPGTGLYTAGSQVGADTVVVTDSMGSNAMATVSVSAAVLTISPATTNVSAGSAVAFVAGGGQAPHTFSLATNNSGGSVTSGGLYTAGYIAGTDAVLVTDSVGSNALATITVTVVPLAIQPTTTNVSVGTSVAFGASGGKPPYSFAITANNSGGTINAGSGLYTSGTSAGLDTIQVTDDLGSNVTATVTVTVQIQTAQLLVDVDATGLASGTLTSITNRGTLGGFFYARGGGTTVPVVAAVDGGGTKGIRFDGDDYLQHVVSVGGALVPAPAGLVGVNPTCTIEVWVLNGAIDREETILAWGKRSGLQTQSHHAFIYGWDAAWGAMAHWDSPTSIGWTSGLDGGGIFSAGVPSAGVWHHLVYTFDGTTQRVYADGVQKNSEVVSLNIASGPPINLAAQMDANGTTVTATLRGSLTIGKVRIHDGVLSASQIATNYLLEVAAFTNGPGVQLLSSPAHRYQFNNTAGAATAGSVIQDSVGTANGTVLGSGATFTGSRLTLPGGASGTAAYVDLPDGLLSVNSTTKGGSGEVTIEGWVKPTASRAWSRFFDFGSSSGGSGQDYVAYLAQVNTDIRNRRLDIQNNDSVGGTGGGGSTGHGTTTYGQDVHFAITWNDATGEIKIYENGEFAINRTETVRLAQLNDVNVWLGRSQWSSDLNLQGEFDEFRMYNRVLTDAELRGNFVRGPSDASAQLTTFTVTGGGAGCGSVPVGLNGSEVGVTYLLRTNLVYAGVLAEGTGGALSFGNQTVGGTYSVLASNTATAATALMNGSVAVSIVVPPAITAGPSPSNLTNYQGGYLSFSVTATGSPLNYQWRRDGTNLVNGGSISGATSNRLTIYPANPSDSVGAGHGYVCVVSNSCLSLPSPEATATIIPFVAVPETVAVVWTNHNPVTNSLTSGGNPRSVLVDNEGNIIVTGYTDGATNGYWRVTAIKYSSSGVPLWTNDNNGMLEDQDLDPKAALDGNGNLLVVKGSSQIVVDKYSRTNGLLLWEKRFGSLPNNLSPSGLAVDSSGNAIFTGKFFEGQTTYHTNYSYTAKLAAADGLLLWERFHGPSEAAQGIAVDGAGNVVITGGRAINSVKSEAVTVKYSGVDGAQIWETQSQSPGLESAGPNAIAIDALGNVAIAGYTEINSASYLYVAKYAAANGALLWERSHTVGPAARNYAIAMDADGNVVTTGQDNSDSYTAKYAASDGSLLWDRRYHDPNNRLSFFTAVVADGNNDVIVTGWAGYGQDQFTGNSTLTSDIYTGKYAGKNGAVLWSTRFNGLANRDDTTTLFCQSVAITPAGEVVVVGATDGGFVFPIPYAEHWVTIKYAGASPNARPVVANPIPNANGIYGTPFNFSFAANTFSDPDAGQTLAYSAGGLPTGITFTPATRTFSGTPTTVGTHSVTVTATDNGSPALSTNDVFDLIIAKAPLTVTAFDTNRVYGTTNPPLTGSLVGVVNSDNVTATFATPATTADPPGNYPITPVWSDPDGKLGNYSVTTNSGTLTVLSPPEMSFSLGGGGGGLFTLSWPASYVGFVLECTESLTPPVVWQEITSGITESGGTKSYTVMNDSGVTGRLYRLRLP